MGPQLELLQGMPDDIVRKHASDRHCVIITLTHDPRIDDMALMEALCPGKIVTPVYLGQRGHPVGFDQGYFHTLKNLCGDEGARKLINANPASVVALDVGDPGVVVDVDTPAQLAFIQG
jgi:CTP:molybdopterin cytidylyltransferase MocA